MDDEKEVFMNTCLRASFALLGFCFCPLSSTSATCLNCIGRNIETLCEFCGVKLSVFLFLFFVCAGAKFCYLIFPSFNLNLSDIYNNDTPASFFLKLDEALQIRVGQVQYQDYEPIRHPQYPLLKPPTPPRRTHHFALLQPHPDHR